MTSIAKFVVVNITRQTKSVVQPGFGVPLILGPNGPGAVGLVNTYTSLSSFGIDYATSTPEYAMAQTIFGQNPVVASVKAGKTSTLSAQVVTITPTPVSLAVYTVTVNGTVYSFTAGASPTANQIVAGLTAQIAADPAALVTATGSSTLVLTANNPGQGFTYSVGANLAAVLTNGNVGIATDLLQYVGDQTWYTLLTTANDVVTISEAAKTIETQLRTYLVRTSDATVASASTTDIGSKLKNAAYTRTSLWYSAINPEFLDAGEAGVWLPYTPGTETGAFKTINGKTVDNLSDSQQSFLDSKNVNYYIQVAGINVTVNAKVASGEYLDVIRYVDSLQSAIAADVFTALVNQPKVPLTDSGIQALAGIVQGDLKKGEQLGALVAGSSVVTAPKASAISQSEKAARTIGGGGINFTAQLAGAVHKVFVNGTVTL